MNSETHEFLKALYGRQISDPFLGHVDISRVGRDLGIEDQKISRMGSELLTGNYIQSFASPPLPSGGYVNPPRSTQEQFGNFVKVTDKGIDFLDKPDPEPTYKINNVISDSQITDSTINQGTDSFNQIYNINKSGSD